MNESEKEFMKLWKQLNEENKDEIYNRIYEYKEEKARERRTMKTIIKSSRVF